MLFGAVDELDATTDDPEESGEYLDVPVSGGDSLDEAAAAGVDALREQGLTSAQLLG